MSQTYIKQDGGPEGFRTPDLTVKSRLLYLAKLQARRFGISVKNRYDISFTDPVKARRLIISIFQKNIIR